MDLLIRFFERDRFARHLGIEILEHGEGTARAKLELTTDHLNSVGSAHGGIISSLADTAFSVASNSHRTVSVAIQSCISYFKAVNSGALYADAREVSFHQKLATYLVDVTDEDGSLVAQFHGTVYRKSESIEKLLASTPSVEGYSTNT
jgi:acyl-CoA thioesterase